MYAVVDLETSGLSLKRDEVIEIAVVLVDRGEILEQWSSLVKPTIPVRLSAVKVHGIDNDTLMIAPRKGKVIPEVVARVGGRILVEHNLNGFDRRFLSKFIGFEPWQGCINTLLEAKRVWPKLPKYDLPALCVFLGIDLRTHHQALDDAVATAQVLLYVLGADADSQKGHRVARS